MNLLSDLRVALRGLLRSKGFAAAGALTLGLGIAATTTIFSVVYGVLLRPLPYPDAERLVVIEGEKAYSTGPRIMNFSGPELEPFVDAAGAFSSVASVHMNGLTYRGDAGVESINSATVSGEFFATLGTAPLLGRTLGDEPEPHIVISERLWRRLLSGSPQVVGQTMRFTGSENIERAYTVVGVMPSDFQYPHARTDVWKPLAFVRAMKEERVLDLPPGGRFFIARVKDGITVDGARADAARVVDTVLKPHFTTSRIDMYARVTTLSDELTGTIGPALWILMGAVTLVLLVACANVANLILARQSTRAREISVRLALGAPRARLLTFLLTEVVITAASGAVAGVAAAFAGIRLLQWLEPRQLPRLDAIQVDVPVLAFAVGVAIATVMLAGLVPAWIATRTDAALTIKTGGRGTGPSGIARHFRSALIVAEIAVAILLLVGASLLSRTLFTLMSTDVGVNRENVISAMVSMSLGRTTTPERQQQIAADLEQRLARLPAVQSVGFGSGVPPHTELMRVSFILSNGTSTESHMVTAVPASPGYFSTLQIRLLQGRLFTDADTATAPPVVIINREAARRFFPNADPIGRSLPLNSTQITVVGVVDNVKYTGIASGPEGVIYRPFAQQPMPIAVLLARTHGDPAAIAPTVREMIKTYDAGLSVPRIEPLSWWMADAASQPRIRAVMLSAIAVMTLLLAMVGLYGVIAYSTAQRTTEIGVRMAIGAQQSDVIRMVISEGVRLALAGVVVGTVAAYWLTSLLASFLYGVATTDLASFAGSAACLFIVALVASYVPAARAARVDPGVALREAP